MALVTCCVAIEKKLGGGLITKKELEKISKFSSKIKILEKEIEALQLAQSGKIFDTVSGSLPNYPYTKTIFSISGYPEKAANNKNIDNLKAELAKTQKAAQLEYLMAMEKLNAIEDPHIYSALKLRYVNGLSWARVAAEIGGNNTEDSVRKAARRYLK